MVCSWLSPNPNGSTTKLPEEERRNAQMKEELFKENRRNKRLSTTKLKLLNLNHNRADPRSTKRYIQSIDMLKG